MAYYGYDPGAYLTDRSYIAKAGSTIADAIMKAPDIYNAAVKQRENKDAVNQMKARAQKLAEFYYAKTGQTLTVPDPSSVDADPVAYTQQIANAISEPLSDAINAGKINAKDAAAAISAAQMGLSTQPQIAGAVERAKTTDYLGGFETAAQPLTVPGGTNMGLQIPQSGQTPSLQAPQVSPLKSGTGLLETPQLQGQTATDVGIQNIPSQTPTLTAPATEPTNVERVIEPEANALKSAEFAAALKKQVEAGLNPQEARLRMLDYDQKLRDEKDNADKTELATMMKEYYDADTISKDFAAKNVITKIDEKIVTIDEKIKDIRAVGRMVVSKKPEAAVEAAKRGLPADTYAVNKALTELELDKKQWETRRKNTEEELKKLMEQHEIDKQVEEALTKKRLSGGNTISNQRMILNSMWKKAEDLLRNQYPNDWVLQKDPNNPLDAGRWIANMGSQAATIWNDPVKRAEFIKTALPEDYRLLSDAGGAGLLATYTPTESPIETPIETAPTQQQLRELMGNATISETQAEIDKDKALWDSLNNPYQFNPQSMYTPSESATTATSPYAAPTGTPGSSENNPVIITKPEEARNYPAGTWISYNGKVLPKK
jgi:hypothetical protein